MMKHKRGWGALPGHKFFFLRPPASPTKRRGSPPAYLNLCLVSGGGSEPRPRPSKTSKKRRNRRTRRTRIRSQNEEGTTPGKTSGIKHPRTKDKPTIPPETKHQQTPAANHRRGHGSEDRKRGPNNRTEPNKTRTRDIHNNTYILLRKKFNYIAYWLNFFSYCRPRFLSSGLFFGDILCQFLNSTLKIHRNLFKNWQNIFLLEIAKKKTRAPREILRRRSQKKKAQESQKQP